MFLLVIVAFILGYREKSLLTVAIGTCLAAFAANLFGRGRFLAIDLGASRYGRADGLLPALLAFAATLLVLLPLFGVIALFIKMTSNGPVFFTQERVGYHRRRFHIIKFRTMVPEAEKMQAALEVFNEADGPAFKIQTDPRITPSGRWLRRRSTCWST